MWYRRKNAVFSLKSRHVRLFNYTENTRLTSVFLVCRKMFFLDFACYIWDVRRFTRAMPVFMFFHVCFFLICLSYPQACTMYLSIKIHSFTFSRADIKSNKSKLSVPHRCSRIAMTSATFFIRLLHPPA